MEQFEYPASRFLKVLLLIVILILPACKSEDPEPEKKDPIYNDLLKEQASAAALIEKQVKKLEELDKEYEKTEVRTIDRKSTQRDIVSAQEALRKAQQQAEYYRIALIKRQFEARASYKRAFAADKVWPDPKEFESYSQEKKMMSVSRNWSTRVPKGPATAVEAGEKKENAEETASEAETPKAEH